jgi:EpsI family protein
LPEIRSGTKGLLLTVLLVSLVAVAYQNLIALQTAPTNVLPGEGAFFSPSDSSPGLMLAVTAWLVYNRRTRIWRALEAPAAPVGATLCLVLAAAWFTWASYVQAFDLLVPSLMCLLLGGGFLMGGRPLARVLLMPTLFLVFSFPIQGALLNQLVYPLQIWTAKYATLLLGMLNIQAWTVGDQIYTGGRIFHVIETCSGLRSMQTLAWASLLHAELMHLDPRRAFILMLAAPPIAFAVNGLRVLTIMLNPASEVIGAHTTQGIVALVIGVLLIAALEVPLRRLAPKKVPPAKGPAQTSRPQESTFGLRVGALVAFLGMLVALRIGVPTWTPEHGASWFLTVPGSPGDWHSTTLETDAQFLGGIRFAQHAHRRYQKGDEVVDLFVGYDDRLSRDRSLVSAKNELPGAGTEVVSRGDATLESGPHPLTSALIRSRRRLSLSYHWYAGTKSLGEEIGRQLLALDRGPQRRGDRALVFRVTTPVGPGPAGLAAASERLEGFVALVAPDLDRLAGS